MKKREDFTSFFYHFFYREACACKCLIINKLLINIPYIPATFSILYIYYCVHQKVAGGQIIILSDTCKP